jgi:hypothetical protein
LALQEIAAAGVPFGLSGEIKSIGRADTAAMCHQVDNTALRRN